MDGVEWKLSTPALFVKNPSILFREQLTLLRNDEPIRKRLKKYFIRVGLQSRLHKCLQNGKT